MAVTSLLDTLFRRRKKKYTDVIGIFEYDFDTIRAATNAFSDLIGPDRCGSVYKGKLESGQEIAVKKLRSRYDSEFLNEINLLPKLRHTNLIHLIGFCSEGDRFFLVYEFMPNSSLDHFIFDPCRASLLSWEMCRNIFVGIARVLRYLHEESGLRVVHRHINPSNILLDEDFQPKLTGFEFARLMEQCDSEAETTRLVGTRGYLAPEYTQTLRVSVKSDVYAFGVTIMTVISRRRAYSGGEEEPLIQYAMSCWNRGEAIKVIHEVMREEEKEDSITEILRYIHIALLCVDENPKTRPSLDKVLHWFSCLSTPLPEPSNGNQSLAEEETNWLLSPSPGYGSPMSPVSPR